MHRIRNGILAAVVMVAMVDVVGTTQTLASSTHAATKKILATEANGHYVFSKKTVTVKVGTKVTWANVSDAPHTVTSSTTGWKFDKKLPKSGKVSFTFTKAGTFKYLCKYHPGMVGTIIVKM